VQTGKERSEGLRQAQEGCTVVRLVSNCLEFRTKSLFALAQRRHPLAQLLD